MRRVERDAATGGGCQRTMHTIVRQVTCVRDARCSHRALVRPLHMLGVPCIRTHTAETDMERNSNDNFGNQNSSGSTTGSYGAGAPNVSGSTGSTGSTGQHRQHRQHGFIRRELLARLDGRFRQPRRQGEEHGQHRGRQALRRRLDGPRQGRQPEELPRRRARDRAPRSSGSRARAAARSPAPRRPAAATR